ncbi:purine and uridine phosphorylase, partial [Aspergillus homomorphus CBS 101889]
MCQERYTVGLVSALPKELYAVRALFDHRHQDPVGLDPHDTNSYVFGRIGHHDVVAACLPQGEYGTNSAADVATNMSRSFPALQFCLLIGRGGGVPSPENDVRLGDVVVSLPTDTHPGVIQYDLGKATADDTFKATGLLTRPPRVLTEAIINLTSDDTLPPDFLRVFMQQVATRNSSYHSPGLENDVLHQSDTIHEVSYDKGSGGYDCPLAERSERRSDYPRIFYGIIGSGNQVVKSSRIRDQLGERYHILCLEMEAAGVMNTIPCLVIRGICDYADAHKNKIWQEYAAAAAAAYAKVLLS